MCAFYITFYFELFEIIIWGNFSATSVSSKNTNNLNLRSQDGPWDGRRRGPLPTGPEFFVGTPVSREPTLLKDIVPFVVFILGKTALFEMEFIFLCMTFWTKPKAFIYFYVWPISPMSVYFQIILLTLIQKGDFTYMWLFDYFYM